MRNRISLLCVYIVAVGLLGTILFVILPSLLSKILIILGCVLLLLVIVLVVYVQSRPAALLEENQGYEGEIEEPEVTVTRDMSMFVCNFVVEGTVVCQGIFAVNSMTIWTWIDQINAGSATIPDWFFSRNELEFKYFQTEEFLEADLPVSILDVIPLLLQTTAIEMLNFVQPLKSPEIIPYRKNILSSLEAQIATGGKHPSGRLSLNNLGSVE